MSPDVESRVIKRKVKKMDSGILFRDEDGFTTIAVYPPELKFDEIDFEEMDDDEMDIEELFRGEKRIFRDFSTPEGQSLPKQGRATMLGPFSPERTPVSLEDPVGLRQRYVPPGLLRGGVGPVTNKYDPGKAPWWLPHYGNYMGPWWNNGRYQASSDVAILPPVDYGDMRSMIHDLHYGRHENLKDADFEYFLTMVGRGENAKAVVRNTVAGTAVGAQGVLRAAGLMNEYDLDNGHVFSDLREKYRKHLRDEL